jgi:hypothetical protein
MQRNDYETIDGDIDLDELTAFAKKIDTSFDG